MQKLIKQKVHFCDACHKQTDYVTTCLTCGKEMCYECSKVLMVDYPHGVYFSGSGDGAYCKECDVRLTREGKDQLHIAYRVIRSLRQESNAWNEDFSARMRKAEAHLKSLPRPR